MSCDLTSAKLYLYQILVSGGAERGSWYTWVTAGLLGKQPARTRSPKRDFLSAAMVICDQRESQIFMVVVFDKSIRRGVVVVTEMMPLKLQVNNTNNISLCAYHIHLPINQLHTSVEILFIKQRHSLCEGRCS